MDRRRGQRGQVATPETAADKPNGPPRALEYDHGHASPPPLRHRRSSAATARPCRLGSHRAAVHLAAGPSAGAMGLAGQQLVLGTAGAAGLAFAAAIRAAPSTAAAAPRCHTLARTTDPRPSTQLDVHPYLDCMRDHLVVGPVVAAQPPVDAVQPGAAAQTAAVFAQRVVQADRPGPA